VTSNSTSYTTQSTSASTSSYTVTFYTDPASGTVAADDVMKASKVTGTYSGGQRVHMVANPPGGYSFASWEANGVTIDNQLSQDTYMTVSNDGWLKAHFTGSSHMVAPTDLTVWRPSSGTWFVRHQDGSSWQQTWGVSGDKTLLGDVDGDGVKDLIIWRPSNGLWCVLKSSSNYATYSVYGWGVNGDTPLVGDVDGDGKVDLIIWRPSNGLWCVLKSSSNYATYSVYGWGVNGDTPLVGDFDGDGKADLAIWRPSNGAWCVLKSSTGYTGYSVYGWGVNGDTPRVP
jgi:hypothetical protein